MSSITTACKIRRKKVVKTELNWSEEGNLSGVSQSVLFTYLVLVVSISVQILLVMATSIVRDPQPQGPRNLQTGMGNLPGSSSRPPAQSPTFNSEIQTGSFMRRGIHHDLEHCLFVVSCCGTRDRCVQLHLHSERTRFQSRANRRSASSPKLQGSIPSRCCEL